MPAPAEHYTVVLAPHPSGAWAAFCPAVPGAAAQAGSRATVLDELRLVVAALIEEGVVPLPETPELVASEVAQLLKGRAEDGLPLRVETTPIVVPAPVAA